MDANEKRPPQSAATDGGVDKDTWELANLIYGANKNELLYMLIFMAGMKVGEAEERARKQDKTE